MDDQNAPATKADIAEMRGEMSLLRAEMNHQYDDLKETLRDNETKLLKAFYAFAESNQTRLATIETDSDAVKKRVGILEERVLDLERKVNFPNFPQQ